MRRLGWVVALGLAGCGGDPCLTAQGACIAVTVSGLGSVDRLEFLMSSDGDETAHAWTGGGAKPFPVTTTVKPPRGLARSLTVIVTGLLAGQIIGRGEGIVDLSGGAHARLAVQLDAAYDGGVTPGPGPAPNDMAGTPRLAFLAPRSPVPGRFGALAEVDALCAREAAAAGLAPGRPFLAVIGFPGQPAPKMRIALPGGDRAIQLPADGVTVATDATFFTSSHLAGIAQLADGQAPTTTCVWTNFGADGTVVATAPPDTCAGWTGMGTGAVGRLASADETWAASARRDCSMPCHVYCIEQ